MITLSLGWKLPLENGQREMCGRERDMTGFCDVSSICFLDFLGGFLGRNTFLKF